MTRHRIHQVAFLVLIIVTLGVISFGAVTAWHEIVARRTTSTDAVDESHALVSRIIDGDTFELANGQKVRLIGVDTPETVDPRKPIQYYGEQASEYSKKTLTGQYVKLVKDVSETDKYGRLLRYVYLPDGTFYNEKLARDGYAHVLTIPPDVKYADLFVAAEADARTNKRGLWQ